MSKHFNDEYDGVFGCDPEKYDGPKMPSHVAGADGIIHTIYPSKMQELQAAASMMQEMADDFEKMAEDCNFFNGYGGCKRHGDSCTVLSCPLPQLSGQELEGKGKKRKKTNKS